MTSSWLCQVWDTTRLLSIRLWRMGHGRMVRTIDTAVAWDSGARVRRSHLAHEIIRTHMVFTLLLVHGDMLTYYAGIKFDRVIERAPGSGWNLKYDCIYVCFSCCIGAASIMCPLSRGRPRDNSAVHGASEDVPGMTYDVPGVSYPIPWTSGDCP